MTVKEFSEKYNIPQEKVWTFIKNMSDIAEKPFVRDETKNYSENAMKLLLQMILIERSVLGK